MPIVNSRLRLEKFVASEECYAQFADASGREDAAFKTSQTVLAILANLIFDPVETNLPPLHATLQTVDTMIQAVFKFVSNRSIR